MEERDRLIDGIKQSVGEEAFNGLILINSLWHVLDTEAKRKSWEMLDSEDNPDNRLQAAFLKLLSINGPDPNEPDFIKQEKIKAGLPIADLNQISADTDPFRRTAASTLSFLEQYQQRKKGSQGFRLLGIFGEGLRMFRSLLTRRDI